MTTQMTPEEIAIERQQVEAVFSLGGGELNDSPLIFTDADPEATPTQWTRLWHYDDVPAYATADFEDRHENHVSYLTIVCDCLFGAPPDSIKIGDEVWHRVELFRSSGETQCPCADCDEDPFAGKPCPLCERTADESEHGYVYLGDGWAEVIYRHVDKARLAEDHNVEWWEDHVVTCDSCGATTPAEYWRDSLEHEGTCEDERNPDVVGPRVTVSTDKKWWWWTCSPGCLPESEAQGPYDSEAECLAAATEGLDT